VCLEWKDERWVGVGGYGQDDKQPIEISREGLLQGELFQKFTCVGSLVLRKSHIKGKDKIYNDDELRQLGEGAEQAGWQIAPMPDRLLPRITEHYAAKTNIWYGSQPDEKIGEPIWNDDELFFAIDQAFEYQQFDTVMLESEESGRGVALRNPKNKRSKTHARVICGDDDLLMKAMERYQSFVLDFETVCARLRAN